MESTGAHPYTKLAHTPLAQQTSICGIPARIASIVMCLFALIVVSGSHFVLGWLLLNGRPEVDEDDFFRPKHELPSWGRPNSNMEDIRKTHDDFFDYWVMSVMGWMAIFSGGITSVSGIVALIGAVLAKPPMFIAWFVTMFFGIFLGRVVPLLISLFGTNPYAKFFVLMFVVDIVTIIFIVICWGQLAGVQRNNRYMNWAQAPRFNIKPGTAPVDSGRVLLPPGSYPQQQF